jgi:urease accessory protein
MSVTLARLPLPQAAIEPVRGWQAALRLGFTRIDSRTVLSERHHVGPLVVQRPFHPEGDVCHVYVVHPPGGVVGGDELSLRATLASGSWALLTTPAAGKFYRSAGPQAALSQHLAASDATVEWLPQENIFFSGCRARLTTSVHLQGQARFMGWEICAFGLPARGEKFSGEVRQRFELFRDERPLLIESLRVDEQVAQQRWGLGGATASATLLASPADDTHLQVARTVVGREVMSACTLVDGVLACRALAARSDLLKAYCLDLWAALRPAVLGRPAVRPRIWAT